VAAALVIALVFLAAVEIFVLIQVGQAIGVLSTFALLLLVGLLGAWIVKREGRRVWVALRTGVESGRMPARELLDGALILIGGALLLAPGFVTDIVGLILVLPPTRPLARVVAGWFIGRRVDVQVRRLTGGAVSGRDARAAFGPGGPPHSPYGRQGPVVRGEVVRDDDDPRA
jgi:UPF0716 protein FxsA